MSVSFTNSQGQMYFLHQRTLSDALALGANSQSQYYWSTEDGYDMVEQSLEHYEIREGPNTHPLLLPEPRLQGVWPLNDDILGKIEDIQRPGKSWLLPIVVPKALTGSLPGDLSIREKPDYTRSYLKRFIVEPLKRFILAPVRVEDFKEIEKKIRESNYTLSGLTIDEDEGNVLIEVTEKPTDISGINLIKVSIKDPRGALYYLHTVTRTERGQRRFFYYWSSEVSGSLVPQFPAGYQGILSTAGRPLLVPTNWFQSGGILDPKKETLISPAQTLGQLFSLPEPG